MSINYFVDFNEIGSWSPDYSGFFKITGIIRRDDGLVETVKRRVILLDSKSGNIIRTTYSLDNGFYSFEYLKYIQYGYTVVCFDYPRESSDSFNASIADFITPGPM